MPAYVRRVLLVKVSLSDSTIYMAYYTIAHLLQNIDIGDVEDKDVSKGGDGKWCLRQ